MGTNQIDTDENTPVCLAIKDDDTEAMKCLLDHKLGIGTTIVNNNIDSPFHTTVWIGSPGLIRAYMSHLQQTTLSKVSVFHLTDKYELHGWSDFGIYKKIRV